MREGGRRDVHGTFPGDRAAAARVSSGSGLVKSLALDLAENLE